jgi:hypothetical protein
MRRWAQAGLPDSIMERMMGSSWDRIRGSVACLALVLSNNLDP